MQPVRRTSRSVKPRSKDGLSGPGTAATPGPTLWLAAGAILLLTLLAFAPVRTFDFVEYDDFEYVVGNQNVASGLTAENVRWAWRNPYSGTGGPLTWMSHMLDVELFGLRAGAHHVTSVLLHLAAALTLFFLLRSLTASTWRSAFVAAAFAVHPLHVESVAWVAERKDVLSGLFFFLTIAAYGWYVRRPGWRRYGAVVALFAMGLLSKPMVATLPFVLLLLDVWPLRRLSSATEARQRAPRLVLEKVPLIALAVLVMVATLRAQTQIGAVTDVALVPLDARLANAVISYVAYLGKTIWPAGLVPYYPLKVSLSALTVAACAALLVALTAVAFALARRAPYVTVGWLWFAGMLVPVAGLVQVGGHGMADRFTYLPLTGIFIALAWSVPALAARFNVPKRGVAACAAVILVAWAAVARSQALHWRDGVALWEHTVRVQPDNARAYSNLGVAFAARHRQQDAILAYQQALRLEPGIAQTQHNLGLALEAVGRTSEALARYADAVRLRPDYAKAHMHLANQLAQAGSTEEAIHHYREAIRLQPGEVLPYVNLAVTLGKSGRPAEAIPHILEATRLQPGNAQWKYFAGVMLIEAGRPAEAEQMLQAALAIDPAHAQAREALAYLRR